MIPVKHGKVILKNDSKIAVCNQFKSEFKSRGLAELRKYYTTCTGWLSKVLDSMNMEEEDSKKKIMNVILLK